MVVAKEMVQLTFRERLIIGFSVDYGFTSGSIEGLEWELEGDIEDNLGIASQIKKDKNECDEGTWRLSFKRYKRLDI